MRRVAILIDRAQGFPQRFQSTAPSLAPPFPPLSLPPRTCQTLSRHQRTCAIAAPTHPKSTRKEEQQQSPARDGHSRDTRAAVEPDRGGAPRRARREARRGGRHAGPRRAPRRKDASAETCANAGPGSRANGPRCRGWDAAGLGVGRGTLARARDRDSPRALAPRQQAQQAAARAAISGGCGVPNALGGRLWFLKPCVVRLLTPHGPAAAALRRASDGTGARGHGRRPELAVGRWCAAASSGAQRASQAISEQRGRSVPRPGARCLGVPRRDPAASGAARSTNSNELGWLRPREWWGVVGGVGCGRWWADGRPFLACC